MAAVGAMGQEQGMPRELQGWVSRTSAVLAGVGNFAERVPCSASLILWVPVLENL